MIQLENYDMGYILTTATSDFTISPRTGQLYTRIELDYETQSVYDFEVIATLPDKILRTNVRVRLINLNDNIPVFDRYFVMLETKWLPNNQIGEIERYKFSKFDKFLLLCLFYKPLKQHQCPRVTLIICQQLIMA